MLEAVMLEVYLLHQYYVINLHVLANCCVSTTKSASNLGVNIFRFQQFNPVLVHINYTSNVAASYDNDVTDVTAPHV